MLNWGESLSWNYGGQGFGVGGGGWGKLSEAVVSGLGTPLGCRFPGSSAQPKGMDRNKVGKGRKTHGGHSGVVSWMESAPQQCTGLRGMPRLHDKLTESALRGLAGEGRGPRTGRQPPPLPLAAWVTSWGQLGRDGHHMTAFLFPFFKNNKIHVKKLENIKYIYKQGIKSPILHHLAP